MQRYLDTYIKDLLDLYPSLAGILSARGIGCTTCSVGTCKVKDIIDIHNLDASVTDALIREMGAVIYGGADFEIPKIERRVQTARSSFSPPMRTLVREHTFIMRVIASAPIFVDKMRMDFDGLQPLLVEAIDFIREYADRLHHAKEEDILFGMFDRSQEIIAAMYTDHDEGRAHMKAIREALLSRDIESIATHFAAYGALLTGHIKREDEILYPWMDRQLSTHQVGDLYGRFAEVDARMSDVIVNGEKFAERLERFCRG